MPDEAQPSAPPLPPPSCLQLEVGGDAVALKDLIVALTCGGLAQDNRPIVLEENDVEI